MYEYRLWQAILLCFFVHTVIVREESVKEVLSQSFALFFIRNAPSASLPLELMGVGKEAAVALLHNQK